MRKYKIPIIKKENLELAEMQKHSTDGKNWFYMAFDLCIDAKYTEQKIAEMKVYVIADADSTVKSIQAEIIKTYRVKRFFDIPLDSITGQEIQDKVALTIAQTL